ncbi:MAG: hypothetical protein P4L53_26910 [Candidatus Obscuribacterales bacterium]|nr:hypothetical protein [Candidatus Obscuribacterales bacterium]
MKQITEREKAIQAYLETGKTDSCYPAWGGSVFRGSQEGAKEVREALVAAVKQKSAEAAARMVAAPMMKSEDVRDKLRPMINGLFPKTEREIVLEAIANDVVILTTENVEQILLSESCSSTAWHLANLYLASIGSKPLHEDASCALGMNVGTTSYVSMKYFTQTDKFADYIVHEAAHAFHNCKRTLLGLRETRSREWLLNIDFGERETFAYACEVYSRILELGKSPAARIALAQEAIVDFVPPDEKVDVAKFHAALEEASRTRNGWKRILQICSKN